jgi:hypothetical protein
MRRAGTAVAHGAAITYAGVSKPIPAGRRTPSGPPTFFASSGGRSGICFASSIGRESCTKASTSRECEPPSWQPVTLLLSENRNPQRLYCPDSIVIVRFEITICWRAVSASDRSRHFRVRPWMTRIYLRDHQATRPSGDRTPRPAAHLSWRGPGNRSKRKAWRRQQQRYQ